MDKENLHGGHRDRLRERYLENGLDSFNDINALELLLFYAIPRKDTNEIAHFLLQKFGSLAGVFDARIEDLCTVPGISRNAAVLIHMVTELNRKYLISREQAPIVNTTEEAGAYLLPYFYGRREECVYLLCLDAKGKVLGCHNLFEGTANAVAISPRRIVEVALATNASAVVLAHNHVSGVAVPSEEDEDTTHRIYAALDNLGICLIDHIVVAEDDFISMVADGKLY